MRVGMGYDVHRLVEGRKLILGGVEIPYEKGLLGHSVAFSVSFLVLPQPTAIIDATAATITNAITFFFIVFSSSLAIP